MHRSWKWLLVGRSVVMLVFSSPAQASDAAPFPAADQTAAQVTYTPISVNPSQRPAPAVPANTAPATEGGPASEWKEIEQLPPVPPAPPTGPAAVGEYRDDEERPIGRAKSRLMGNSGICSVVGEIGGTYTYSPIPTIQIEIGSGLGFSGFQFSLMPKLSLGNDHHRFVLGIGPSVGIDPDNNPPHTYVAYWLNAEIGYEYRSVGGFSFLIAGGFFRGIAGEYRDQCVVDCDGDTKGWPAPATGLPPLPQGRIAFGRWF